MRASLISELRFLSANFQQTLDTCLDFSKHAVATVLADFKHLFLLGSGLAEIAAKEGCLKIKELTYMHCQTLRLSGGSIANSNYNYLKANAAKTPLIFLVLDNPFHLEQLEEDIHAMKTLQEKIPGLRSIIITDVKDK